MGASASVIQEYYKAVDYWADIVGNRDWKFCMDCRAERCGLGGQVSGNRTFSGRAVR